jgi:hypothetical protein
MSDLRGIPPRNSRDPVFVHTMTEIQLISPDVVLYETDDEINAEQP